MQDRADDKSLEALREKLKGLADEELAALSKALTRNRTINQAELSILAEVMADRYADLVKSKHKSR